MFSPLKLEVNLDEELNGELLENILSSDKTSKAKIYIPTLMQNISGGSAKSGYENTSGLGIFKNIEGRPSVSKSTLETQNYIESTISGNLDATNLENAINVVGKNITRWVDKRVAAPSKVSVNYVINKGSKVRCKFLNGKVSKLSYSLNSTASTPVTDIKK